MASTPSFIRVGTRVQSASAASLSPGKPSVDSMSGVLLAVVSSKNNAAHSCSTAGWTMIGTQRNSGASFTQSLWIAAETAAAPTFTWTGAVACQAQIAYYTCIDAPLSTTVGSTSVNSGTTSPHSSASINSTQDLSLAVYIDTAAANTVASVPSGWTINSDAGSGTDVGRTTFGSKALPTSGSASGAISAAGANAAWVQRQVEIKIVPATELDSSKMEAGAWLDDDPSADASKMEAGAWLDDDPGVDASKIEVGAWLDPGSSVVQDSGFVSILW